MMQGLYYVESLTGQRHDRIQTESQIATVDSCLDLVGSLQHGVASCEVFSWSDIHKPTICRWWWPQMKLKSKSLPIGQCHMQNAWQGAIGKSRISCRCRGMETADRHKLSRRKIMAKPCKKWAAYRIWKNLRPPKYWTVKMMQRTANENAACLRRI